MSKSKVLGIIAGVVLLNFTSMGFAASAGIKVNGDVVLKNGGTIVFPDGSTQTTATLQGLQGVQGQPGPAGEVSLASICSVIANAGETAPFCTNTVPDAISGINQTLAAYKGIFNAKGTSTTVNDLISLYAINGYLNMGMDIFQDIADTVSADSGYMSTVAVDSAIKYDPVNKIMTALVSMTTANWGTGKVILDFKYDSTASKWLFSGDQRIADISAKVDAGVLTLRVYDPNANIASVYVTGPGFSNYRLLTMQALNKQFSLTLNSTPTPQSKYVFTLKKLDGSVIAYTVYSL